MDQLNKLGVGIEACGEEISPKFVASVSAFIG